MNKKTVVRCTIAGAVTALYAAAAYRTYTDPDAARPSPHKVAITAGALAGLTWICATL
jgi:hypothetical protein